MKLLKKIRFGIFKHLLKEFVLICPLTDKCRDAVIEEYESELRVWE